MEVPLNFSFLIILLFCFRRFILLTRIDFISIRTVPAIVEEILNARTQYSIMNDEPDIPAVMKIVFTPVARSDPELLPVHDKIFAMVDASVRDESTGKLGNCGKFHCDIRKDGQTF